MPQVTTRSRSVRVQDGTIDLTWAEVTDTGRGAVAGGPRAGGYGLAGMRERVTALGGSFTAGPAPAGGFRVHATLPVEEVR